MTSTLHEPAPADRRLRFSATEFTTWLRRRLMRRIRNVRGNYDLRSPPFARTQQVFDERTGDTLAIPVRDRIDVAVLYQMFAGEHYALSHMTRQTELLSLYAATVARNETPLILDIGANIGLAALYLTREFPDARIVGIEPDSDNVACARRNCAGYPMVSFVNAGISHCDGKGRISNPGAESWRLRTEASPDGDIELVSVRTLLSLEVCRSCRPFIAKIDIEGFENDLFAHNTQWVEQFPLVIIELHDWMLPCSANSQTFLRCVSQLNRDFVLSGQNVFSISNTLR